jgi:hypothetical protein
MNVFTATCYKNVIKLKLDFCKLKLGKDYSFQKMAKDCEIQKTYLSKVINNEQAHFNSDQLFRICQFLGLNIEETDFVILLLDLEKSNCRKRQAVIKGKIKELRKQKLETNSHIQSQKISEQVALKNKYYLNPYYQLVHMFLTIPKYSKNLKLVQSVLGIDRMLFHEIINTLEELKIISIVENHVICHKQDLHLSEDSEIFIPYSIGLKTVGMNRFYAKDNDQKYNFSVLFSADEGTRNEIRVEFLKFLKKIKSKVESAKAQEVYQLDFDLFNW